MRGASTQMRWAMKLISMVLGILFVVTVAGVVGRASAASNAPAVGAAAPDFTLKSQENKPVSVHDFKGKWVVLYFYPKDFTSGCTVEAHNFQRDLAQFEQKNAVILGVSGQDENSHQKFCAKEGLNFKLLSDADHSVATKYGSLMDY